MLIAKITDSYFYGGEPQYIDSNTSYNVRGVLYDNSGNAAFMKIENSEYYKLPGGRIEITETPEQAFIREINEQTGYQAEMIGYLGWIEEHKAKRKLCTVSHCFAARIISDNCNTDVLQEAQRRLGFKLEWLNFNDAMGMYSTLSDGSKEYQINFMLKRELLIMQKASELFPA
ncbi:MAG: NUDIX domain-containing protein [Eubacterium sp.]|nr:NUDIX domain-containing protein [Eubacterium sp.]